jgi:hypothetical protein
VRSIERRPIRFFVKERPMLKIWGRKNSANVQKAMWGIGELE